MSEIVDSFRFVVFSIELGDFVNYRPSVNSARPFGLRSFCKLKGLFVGVPKQGHPAYQNGLILRGHLQNR